MTSARDLRIDFCRGLFLLFVLVDHLEGIGGVELASRWTMKGFGFSDASDGFIFLSGYVFGQVYASRIDRGGWRDAFWKALRRCGQLYAANLATLAVVVALVAIAAPQGAFLGGVGRLAAKPMLAARCATLYCYYPWALDILILYVPLLIVGVAVLPALRRGGDGVALVLIPAGILYAAAQLMPWDEMISYRGETRLYFNPFAWQLPFFVAVWLGARGGRAVLPPGVARKLLVPAGLLIAAGLYVVKIRVLMGEPQTIVALRPFVTKWAAGPLRFLHFLATALLFAELVPRSLAFWDWRLVRTTAALGARSLPCYCVSVVLSYAGAVLILGKKATPELVLGADAVACVLLLAVAAVMQRWQAKRTRVDQTMGVDRATRDAA